MLSARMGCPSSAFTSVFTNLSKIPLCAQGLRLQRSPPLKDSNSSSAPPSTPFCRARSRAPRPVESLSSAGAQVPCAIPAQIYLWNSRRCRDPTSASFIRSLAVLNLTGTLLFGTTTCSCWTSSFPCFQSYPKPSRSAISSSFAHDFADWLLRFFVQVVKHQPLSELAGSELFAFERLNPAERDKVVLYLSRLTEKISILPIDPIDFISELYRRWRKKHPAPAGDRHLMNKAHREKNRAHGCIFVSYASPDLEIARYVVGQLQNAGCLVWFDKEQLQVGENWEEELCKAVEERCGLFLSIISDHTAVRLEGYNIFERNLAAKRREKLVDNAIFYLPLRIDGLAFRSSRRTSRAGQRKSRESESLAVI